jgi:RHS repeat-associated protein
VLEEYVDGELSARYVRGRTSDEIVRAELDGTPLFPLQDEMGNVERLTDAAGATVERYEYAGFGEFRVFDSAGIPRATSAGGWKWLFQGREYNALLHAYDFRARTLWPSLGRFGQEDMLHHELPESTNLYQSLQSSFVNRTDPSGRWTIDKSIDTPLLRGAIKRAKLIYNAYSLGSVYKRINPKANARFLEIGTPPRLLQNRETSGTLGTPVLGPTRVEIHPSLLDAAVSHTAAAGILISGLLHEQGHVEAKEMGILENASGFKFWEGTRMVIDVENHRGFWVDRVIYDEGIAFYNPDDNELQFLSYHAATASNAVQINHIRNAKKRFNKWFGTVSTSKVAGYVWDHAKKRQFEVNPDTGKAPGKTPQEQQTLEQIKKDEEWLKSMGIDPNQQ